MEKTVLPFSQVLEQKILDWKKFRWALRREDQLVLDQLFEKARLHVEAGSESLRPWPFETILISILLEHEKALAELKLKIKVYKKRDG